ncbi:MAG: hypothetical protein K0T99_04225, partial [Alphaproteobacteria bacterium]|nr:hypothetical protein [Alphaproteobacteria bacterium]
MIASVIDIKEKLSFLLKQENSSNAFILSATKGAGKSQFISDIIEDVFDSNDILYSNIKWVRSEKDKILVSQIREIYNFLGKTCYNKFPRIVIIDPADDLNIQSSNALLKILEDGSPNAYFILITHNINCLLRTIRSRCINFKLPISPVDNEIQDTKTNQALYITKGVVGSAKIITEGSGIEFYKLMLETIDKIDKDVQILYKFLDKHFAKDMPDSKWFMFTMLVEHILTKIANFESNADKCIIEEETNLFNKLFSSFSSLKRETICDQVRELVYKSGICNLSRYNVALLFFLKIRGV